MAVPLTCDGQLHDAAPAALPQSLIYIAAFFKFRERLLRGYRITIDLPWPDKLTVPAFVFYEPGHVIKRIAKEYSDLMRKRRASVLISTGEPCLKMSETILETAARSAAAVTAVTGVISEFMQK